MRKEILYIVYAFLFLAVQSCFDSSAPNYQYFPDMYEPIGYTTYSESDAFNNGIEAQEPVNGTIPRGMMLYEYPNSNEGYENAKRDLLSPIEFSEEDRIIGKELYGIYCALCHGNKGDGQGILMKREKFLGVPSYADRDITLGSIYHVLIYGRNAMGSHSGQLNIKERWQVSHYAMELRKELIK